MAKKKKIMKKSKLAGKIYQLSTNFMFDDSNNKWLQRKYPDN